MQNLSIMKKVILMFLVLASLLSHAQENSQKRFGLRSGLFFDYYDGDYEISPIFVGFSLFDNKSNSHTFEIQQLFFSNHKQHFRYQSNKMPDDNNEILCSVKIVYKYDYFITKNGSRVRPYLGPSTYLGFLRKEIETSSPLIFPETLSEFSHQLMANIGANFDLTRNLYFDLYVPFELASYTFYSQYIENLNIEEKQRHSQTLKFKLYPFDHFFLGLSAGVRF